MRRRRGATPPFIGYGCTGDLSFGAWGTTFVTLVLGRAPRAIERRRRGGAPPPGESCCHLPGHISPSAGRIQPTPDLAGLVILPRGGASDRPWTAAARPPRLSARAYPSPGPGAKGVPRRPPPAIHQRSHPRAAGGRDGETGTAGAGTAAARARRAGAATASATTSTRWPPPTGPWASRRRSARGGPLGRGRPRARARLGRSRSSGGSVAAAPSRGRGRAPRAGSSAGAAARGNRRAGGLSPRRARLVACRALAGAGAIVMESSA